jgi:hypothetical protein
MDDDWWNQKVVPVAESPLDPWRGSGRHATIKKPRERRVRTPIPAVQDASGVIMPALGTVIMIITKPETK